jgi:hypothetical protein
MPVIAYQDINFQGLHARLQPGFYSGRDLQGYRQGSTSGEDLDNMISSIRVDPGYIAVIYVGQSASATSGARALVGPIEYADLGVIGMDDRISAVQVLTFQTYLSAAPRDFGVTIYSQAYKGGRNADLGQGDYNRMRLDGDEVRFAGSFVRSICVGPSTLAVLYAGNMFEDTLNSIVVVGPTCIEDLDDVGMMDTVNSVRILYTQGGARAYYPGGSYGTGSGAGYGGYPAAMPGTSYPPYASLMMQLRGLGGGAQDLLLPDTGDYHPYGANWAGGPSLTPTLDDYARKIGPPTDAAAPQVLAAAPAPSPPPAPPREEQVVIIQEDGGAMKMLAFVLILLIIVAIVAGGVYLAQKARAKKSAGPPALALRGQVW